MNFLVERLMLVTTMRTRLTLKIELKVNVKKTQNRECQVMTWIIGATVNPVN